MNREGKSSAPVAAGRRIGGRAISHLDGSPFLAVFLNYAVNHVIHGGRKLAFDFHL